MIIPGGYIWKLLLTQVFHGKSFFVVFFVINERLLTCTSTNSIFVAWNNLAKIREILRGTWRFCKYAIAHTSWNFPVTKPAFTLLRCNGRRHNYIAIPTEIWSFRFFDCWHAYPHNKEIFGTGIRGTCITLAGTAGGGASFHIQRCCSRVMEIIYSTRTRFPLIFASSSRESLVFAWTNSS